MLALQALNWLSESLQSWGCGPLNADVSEGRATVSLHLLQRLLGGRLEKNDPLLETPLTTSCEVWAAAQPAKVAQ